MMKRCLDEGTLQAYLDGELSQEAARDAAAHISQCAPCAEALAEAGSETAFFASAFTPDPALSVPSAELRARINAAVARLESSTAEDASKTNGWSFGALVASLSGLFTLTPQRAAALAGVAAVLVLVTVSYFNQPGRNGVGEIASSGPGKAATPQPTKSPETPSPSPSPATADNGNGVNGENVGGSAPKAGRGVNRKGKTPFTPVPVPKLDQNLKQKFLPGETEYQSTIATLDKTIKAGDAVLKPAVIADYERNIAMLDKAIEETRRVALRNPKDKDAVNFLLSAYRSKVELMTTVADSAQVATLDR